MKEKIVFYLPLRYFVQYTLQLVQTICNYTIYEMYNDFVLNPIGFWLVCAGGIGKNANGLIDICTICTYRTMYIFYCIWQNVVQAFQFINWPN